MAGPDAYGWQRCTAQPVRGSSDQHLMVTGATGVYDPEADSGLGEIEDAYWHHDTAEVRFRTHRAVWNGVELLDPDHGSPGVSWPNHVDGRNQISQFGLRSVESISSMFDTVTLAVDVVDPANTKPVVQAIPAPSESGIDLRLEGVPNGWPSSQEDLDVWNQARATGWLTMSFRALWLIDVWASDGMVERVRMQSEQPDGGVSEIRFVSVAEVVDEGGLILPSCPDDPAGSSDWFGSLGWEPTRSVPLDVSLDPEGRPYDLPIPEGVEVVREPVGELAVPGGEMLVMGGGAVAVDPGSFADQGTVVSVAPERVRSGGVHEVNLEMIWEEYRYDGELYRNPLGVWLGPSDSLVTAWDAFETAYVTDGAAGGIVPTTVAQFPLDDDEFWITEPDYGSDYQLHDLDGVPGPETFVFHNGLGDGAFPLARGRDANGEVVAVVIWRTDYPWRVAIPDGRPPVDVTDRELHLIECMEGGREVSPAGICRFDDAMD